MEFDGSRMLFHARTLKGARQTNRLCAALARSQRNTASLQWVLAHTVGVTIGRKDIIMKW
jgi:hypothetical protein